MSSKTLHIISYPEFFDGESEHIITILKSTEVIFHLRKPEVSDEVYEAFVRSLPKACYGQIILHSAYHLAQEFDFAGLHFSTSKRKDANEFLKDFNCSTSCHSIYEVKSLLEGFCACFLSPVYSSISKEGYEGNLDLKEVSTYLLEERKTQVIALGGICQDNINETLEMGFDGVAVLGTIWGKSPCREDDFLQRVLLLVNTLKNEKC